MRWKLISLLLAGSMSYSWWQGKAASTPRSAAAATKRWTGPLRVSASALGISTDELVRRLFTTKDTAELEQLAERLGIVGDDAAIDQVLPLVHDPSCRIQAALVQAFGAIGTEHAVDVLLELVRDRRDSVRGAAAEALGRTGNVRGAPALIELATRAGDAAQLQAIGAIGALGEVARANEGVLRDIVATLEQLASHPDEIAGHAMRALARLDTPAARAARIRLVDSPSLAVAASAIGALPERDLDPELVDKLAAVARGGEPALAGAALEALARAGEAGIAVMREVALHGAPDLRRVAIDLLGDSAGVAAVDTLRTILETEQGRVADEAADVLSRLDSDDAREALISAALAADDTGSRALEYLLRQQGPEIDQALLVVAKSDSRQRWEAVEHLVRGGNTEAIQLAIAGARGGEREQRLGAIEALAQAGTPEAVAAVVEVARGSDDIAEHALGILGTTRADDPAVAGLLRDAVRASDPGRAATAARALGNAGTGDARDALIGALASSDADIATNAAAALARFRLTDDVTAALRGAARAHPELKSQVMTQLLSSGSPVGIELAREALAGGDGDQASRAIAALEQARTPAAFDALAQVARAGDPYLRAEAVASLGGSGDRRAAEVVAGLVRDGEPAVRVAAARTLGRFGTAEARDLLVGMTRSASPEDRRAAIASLGRFEDADSQRRLAELVRDPDPSIGYAAIGAAADRSDAHSTLRGLLTDPGAPGALRYEAARQLSYRGYSDPSIDALLSDDP